jgi:Glyoxalase-like domain
MSERPPRVRLRQAVFVARERDAVADALRTELGLGEPFHDPGVSLFGLANSVFAIGDCFLEVVSPVAPDTAAGRYLERHGGDGGYMVMFDLEDLDGARSRVKELGIRVVWQVDLPDIADYHLHPADTGGAIVALDRSNPFGSWRWGGPAWEGKVGTSAPGRLTGIAVAVDDPSAVAARWAQVLGVGVSGDTIELDGGEIRFLAAHDPRAQGLVEIDVRLPDERRDEIELGGVRLRLLGAR